VVSGNNFTPRLATTGSASKPAVTTLICARRKISMTVTASNSSQPCANGTKTVFIAVPEDANKNYILAELSVAGLSMPS
jgi:hypothetical protein